MQSRIVRPSCDISDVHDARRMQNAIHLIRCKRLPDGLSQVPLDATAKVNRPLPVQNYILDS